MDGRTDGQAVGRRDRQKDLQRNGQGRTDGSSYSDGVTHKDDSMDLFDELKSSPSRDAVDDQFQRTLDVPTGMILG